MNSWHVAPSSRPRASSYADVVRKPLVNPLLTSANAIPLGHTLPKSTVRTSVFRHIEFPRKSVFARLGPGPPPRPLQLLRGGDDMNLPCPRCLIAFSPGMQDVPVAGLSDAVHAVPRATSLLRVLKPLSIGDRSPTRVKKRWRPFHMKTGSESRPSRALRGRLCLILLGNWQRTFRFPGPTQNLCLT